MNHNNFITEFDHPEHNWKWTKLEVHFINNRMQSHIDYTRAVIAERDALKAELEVAHISIKQLAEVRDKTQQEANQLRKAAQMVMDTLQYLYSDMTDHENDVVNDSIKVIRKELGL